MDTNAISRRAARQRASRAFCDLPTWTGEGLVLGDTVLAKLDANGLPVLTEHERMWTLLGIAYGDEAPCIVLDRLRRAAGHWRSGDNVLAAIQIVQTGLRKIDEETGNRLSLAEALFDAGMTPRTLARELGLCWPGDLEKYDPSQPRVPAGNGHESGQKGQGDQHLLPGL